MTKNKSESPSILFIDSGIGGLSTLSETMGKNIANYIYFADNKYAPYGTKSDSFLKKRLCDIIYSQSKKYKLSMVVLACNTATTTAISFLRTQFPNLLFVGTEPAYKLALDKTFKSPAIIATPQTINHLHLQTDKNFKFIPHKNLASLVEQNLTSNSMQSRLMLLKSIYNIKNQTKNCDCLVLGCTHYVFLKEKLSKVLNIPIFDGNPGVARQIIRNNPNISITKHDCKLILSKKNHTLLQKYKKILKQILANQINLC